jgi:hypothetical protein
VIDAASSQARVDRTGQVNGDDPKGNTQGASLSFLVGFGLAQPHHRPVAREVDVLDIEADKFGPAEAACEAEQQDRAIPDGQQAVGHGGEHRPDLVGQQSQSHPNGVRQASGSSSVPTSCAR